ncbi:type I-E CRISPR-associated protein Cse1/CasA, partial [Streptomyces noursei]
MPVVLLHREDQRYGQKAVDALNDAEKAVGMLADLAADLALASGADPAPRSAAARDQGFGTLDTHYRRWLRDLGAATDPEKHRDRWKREVHRILSDLGTGLLDDAGLAAWEGRTVETSGGPRWLNDAAAQLRFRKRLDGLLATDDDGPPDPPATQPAPVESPV